MESKIVHASEGYRRLKSVFRFKLKRAWRAFCRIWSSDRVNVMFRDEVVHVVLIA